MTTSDTGPVLHAYTAEQAVADGLSVQFNPATALECGFAIPVILTRAAFADAVEWTRTGESFQDVDARFWDVLNLVRQPAKAALRDGEPHTFRVLRVLNTTASGARSRAQEPTLATLTVRAEGFNLAGAPCIVIDVER